MSVETFLATGPLSLDEIIDAVRTQSLDSSAKPVFSDSEIKLALRQAVINSAGKFFVSNSYDLTFTGEDASPYTLPDDIQRITMVWRQPSGNETAYNDTLNGSLVGQEIHYYRHKRTLSSNKLYLTRDYPNSTFTIFYERDVQVPIDNRATSGAHTSAVTTLTLSNDDPQLYRLALPAYFRWDNEIIKMTAAASNISATIARGQLGSTAAAHTTGSEISQLVTADNDRFYNFLFQEMGRLLNEFRVQAGSQNVSVAANITAARMMKDNREAILQQIPQTKAPRKMKFVRSRAPRRAV